VRYDAVSISNMHKAHVDDLDIRSIALLATLLKTASVTKTGETFGLSQPAASRAIQRLRDVLGDPLLVRTSRGWVLTPRAERLKPLVSDAQAGLANLFSPEVFDPSRLRRTFTVATTDYGAIVVLSKALPIFTKLAPNSQIVVQTFGGGVFGDLASGLTDLALYSDDETPADFHYRDLFAESYICILGKSHPLARLSASDLDFIFSFPRAVMLYPGGHHIEKVDDPLGDLGAPPSKIVFRTPYFAMVPSIVCNGDVLMCIPRRAARLLGNSSESILMELPAPLPRFSYRVIWHDRTHRDQGNIWLRSLIRDSFLLDRN
jgi:DNA-binding transcriptional LysR family regulator